MRALCLLLIVCGACTKKPAPKTPVPPPAETTAPAPSSTPPEPETMERKGDPCEGGEKPN
jgi:hypothetical protein